MEEDKKPKIIVICGPTAVGKSSYAIELAKRVDGEIISADSRQIYKEIDLASGKVTIDEMQGVPHHFISKRKINNKYTVNDFQTQARKKIAQILNRGKVPIICGGTGFYIDYLIYDLRVVEVKINKKLRKELNKKSTEELFELLKTKDLERASNIDRNNKVRLVRALEILETLEKVPSKEKKEDLKMLYDTKIIYLDLPDEVLKNKIKIRLEERIKAGMIEEIRKLKEKYSKKRIEELGLEMRFISKYLDNELTLDEMKNQLFYAIWHYAKRQRTYFREYKAIPKPQ